MKGDAMPQEGPMEDQERVAEGQQARESHRLGTCPARALGWAAQRRGPWTGLCQGSYL